jgi:hypothetical protein
MGKRDLEELKREGRVKIAEKEGRSKERIKYLWKVKKFQPRGYLFGIPEHQCLL